MIKCRWPRNLRTNMCCRCQTGLYHHFLTLSRPLLSLTRLNTGTAVRATSFVPLSVHEGFRSLQQLAGKESTLDTTLTPSDRSAQPSSPSALRRAVSPWLAPLDASTLATLLQQQQQLQQHQQHQAQQLQSQSQQQQQKVSGRAGVSSFPCFCFSYAELPISVNYIRINKRQVKAKQR